MSFLFYPTSNLYYHQDDDFFGVPSSAYYGYPTSRHPYCAQQQRRRQREQQELEKQRQYELYQQALREQQIREEERRARQRQAQLRYQQQQQQEQRRKQQLLQQQQQQRQRHAYYNDPSEVENDYEDLPYSLQRLLNRNQGRMNPRSNNSQRTKRIVPTSESPCVDEQQIQQTVTPAPIEPLFQAKNDIQSENVHMNENDGTTVEDLEKEIQAQQTEDQIEQITEVDEETEKSLKKIQDISQRVHDIETSLNRDETPSKKQLRMNEEFLIQQLLKLDEIVGNDQVRTRRKAEIIKIQSTLDKIDEISKHQQEL